MVVLYNMEIDKDYAVCFYHSRKRNHSINAIIIVWV